MNLPSITLTGVLSPARIPDLATQMQRELSTYWMPLAEPIYEWASYPKDADYWYTQAGRALQDATHHWSRAACALDTLTPDELTADDLDEVRRMSGAARTQQERLWKLTDEVSASIADWRKQHQTAAQQEVQA